MSLRLALPAGSAWQPLQAWQGWMVRLRRATRAFDGRPLRERLCLAVAVAVALLALLDQVGLEPALRHLRQAQGREQEARQALEQLQAEVLRAGTVARQRNREIESERLLLQSQAGQAPVTALQPTLMTAREMVPLLEQLLAREPGLKVRSLSVLPRTELGAKPAAGDTPAAAQAPQERGPQVYRHGVEIAVEGRYQDLLGYVQSLQALPHKLLWGDLRLKVEAHPRVVLTLRLYTLGLDRHWLEI